MKSATLAKAALFLAATALVAGGAITQAMSANPAVPPATAATVAPAAPVVLKREFAPVMTSGAKSIERAAYWQMRARQVLAGNPLDSVALRILAISSAGEPNAAESTKREFQLSERVSRRDLFTQLWLIEEAITRGSIPDALTHYDRALLAHPEFGATLFPILTQSLSEVEIRQHLAGYIRADQPWTTPFLYHVIADGKDPALAVDLLRRAGQRASSTPERLPIASGLIGKLVAKGDFALADAYARQVAGGAGWGIGDLRFADETMATNFRPLTWTPSEDTSFTSDLDGAGGIALRVAPGANGIALFRMLRVAPGNYRLNARATFADAAQVRGSWRAHCLGEKGGAELAALPLASGSGSVALEIPATCAGLRLAFVVDTNAASLETSITLHSVALTRTTPSAGNATAQDRR